MVFRTKAAGYVTGVPPQSRPVPGWTASLKIMTPPQGAATSNDWSLWGRRFAPLASFQNISEFPLKLPEDSGVPVSQSMPPSARFCLPCSLTGVAPESTSQQASWKQISIKSLFSRESDLSCLQSIVNQVASVIPIISSAKHLWKVSILLRVKDSMSCVLMCELPSPIQLWPNFLPRFPFPLGSSHCGILWCPLTTLDPLLPQDLCTCCFPCLEWAPLRSP